VNERYAVHGMPVDREAVNKTAAMKAASTTADPSHHGIDRQRIIRMPMRRPTAAARNFHGRPGDGAGNTRSTEVQNRNTGDRCVPSGHAYRGIIKPIAMPDAITTSASPVRHASLASASTGRRSARTSTITPTTVRQTPVGKMNPDANTPMPHGPFDVASPATHVSSSHADHMKTTPPSRKHTPTVR